MTASSVLLAAAAILGQAGPSPAGDGRQTWSHSGFVEARGWAYEAVPNPGDVKALGDFHGELGARASIRDWLSLGGRWDFRLDTDGEVDKGRWLDLDQRGLSQPAGALGELYLDLTLKRVDVRVGTQEVHWGRADGINPTDNVDPYDYLHPFSSHRLGVPTVRVQTDFGRAGLEGVWVPFFTPARLPLLGMRWYPRLPDTTLAPLGPDGQDVLVDVTYQEGTRTFPARTLANGQWGVRWNQIVPRGEFSLSFLDAWNDAGYLSPTTISLDAGAPVPRLAVAIDRQYFRTRVLGFDFASELGPVGIRGEMALVDETDPDDLDRLVYVVGLDRRWGDWFLIAQYADRIGGQPSANTPVFPNLGLRSTLLTRIERTIDPSKTLELRIALGLHDRDFLMQLSYGLALTDVWKLTLAGALAGGSRTGFLGQYHGSGSLSVQIRRSF